MFENVKPEKIEARSFEIIRQELGDIQLNPQQAPVIMRAIHTSADFDYAENLYFSHDAMKCGLAALKNGADIVTDTNMAKAGINKTALAKLGGEVHCFMAKTDVALAAKEKECTRATICMEKAAQMGTGQIFAIGNAPTALIKLKELCDQGVAAPSLVIAAPVGFVNVVAAKELFVDAGIPAIVARGRKGGSNIAAAICNALIYLCTERE